MSAMKTQAAKNPAAVPIAAARDEIATPYLIFLGDCTSEAFAKTAFGVHDWCPERCVGEWRLPGCSVSTGLPQMSPAQGIAAGARSLLLGVSPIGGRIPPAWVSHLLVALEAGLDLVSGMHERLADHPEISRTAARLGRRLHDVRHTSRRFEPGTGQPRSGKRVLTVGTDCALGKKYTALAITRELVRRGRRADFRATGQTGIMIAGSGVAIDAVISDFIAGAAEWLSPAAAVDHWDVIEGQGSLFHPAYAGVTLGLLHGSQPDALVLCHDPLRPHINGYPLFPLPTLEEAIEIYTRLARLTNRDVRVVGVSLNTSKLDDEASRRVIAETEARLGLPCCDPVRSGLAGVVDALEAIHC